MCCVACCGISIWKNRKDMAKRKASAPSKKPKTKPLDQSAPPNPPKNVFMERMSHNKEDGSNDQNNDNLEGKANQLPYSICPPVANSQPYSPNAPLEFPMSGTTEVSPPPYGNSSSTGYPLYLPINSNTPSYATDLFSPQQSSPDNQNVPYPTTMTNTNFPSYPPKP